MPTTIRTTTTVLLAFAANAAPFAKAPPQEPVALRASGQAPDGVTSATGRLWKLGDFNKTTRIDAAYLYEDKVVIFGWINSYAGITTILNAATGVEQLEFLAFSPRITPRGLLIFRRFYPHFSDPGIISDQIAALDLNGAIPRSVPTREYQNPIDQAGTVVYPSSSPPGIRHLIGDDFVVTGRGRFIFLVDRLSSGRFCLVRLSLQRADQAQEDQAQKMNCFDPGFFGVADVSSELHVQNLAENSPTSLRLSLNLGPPSLPRREDFTVDRDSLLMWPQPAAEEERERPLAVPWPTQRRVLTGFAGVDINDQKIAAHLYDSARVRLTINYDGSVHNVAVSGTNSDVSDRVKATISRWRFNPTILDGRNVRVVTEFTTEIRGLTKIPN